MYVRQHGSNQAHETHRMPTITTACMHAHLSQQYANMHAHNHASQSVPAHTHQTVGMNVYVPDCMSVCQVECASSCPGAHLCFCLSARHHSIRPHGRKPDHPHIHPPICMHAWMWPDLSVCMCACRIPIMHVCMHAGMSWCAYVWRCLAVSWSGPQ